MVRAKKFVYVKQFQGEPKKSDLQIVEEELPTLREGEILTEAVYLSVDPYMRVYMPKFKKLGDTMIGTQIAKVLESRHKNFDVGSYIVGDFGWRTHTVSDVKQNEQGMWNVQPLPNLGDLPKSLGLGILGMPGNTAYFGLLELCDPQPGETVVVSGAAGAVGSIVGQIAKIRGCQVIGIAGSDKKCQLLMKEYGFDKVINYKKETVKIALKVAAPKGIDCYFDNVGGIISSEVIYQMNERGRIAVCGSISTYNEDKIVSAPILQMHFVFRQLKMEGFIVSRWGDRWLEGINKNLQWINEGKLKYNETITEGFENMFDAFLGMLNGENIGKAIVKV